MIRDSGMAAEGGYMDVKLPSMASPEFEDVWGIGDVVAPTIGLGMAGVFAHFQAEHVVTQIIDKRPRHLRRRALQHGRRLRDGHRLRGRCRLV